jgi:hypothetical protein
LGLQDVSFDRDCAEAFVEQSDRDAQSMSAAASVARQGFEAVAGVVDE